MSSSTRKERLRYWFDSFMSKGGGSIFLSLVILFVAGLLLFALVRLFVYLIYPSGAGELGGALRQIWTAFLELSDVGAMAEDSGSAALYKFLGIATGFTGVVIFSVLIAFLTTALDQKLSDLRKGHSRVIESGQTLILGWNERVVEILRELVAANESEDNPSVVILSERPKEEMDDYLKVHLEERKNTRVVTRSGNTAALVNLQQVAVGECKSVLVLADCTESATSDAKSASDAKVIKTVLAIIACRPEGKAFNIVAEIFEPRNRSVVESLSPEEITTIDTKDVLAKILVQTSLSSGLAVVYSEILGFAGNEMYFTRANWANMQFGWLQFHFPDGVPLGMRHPDGTLALNPPPETPVPPEDEILILTSDNSAIDFRPQPVAAPRDMPLRQMRKERKTENVLILGWSPKGRTIIEQYASYVREGSWVTVMVRDPSPELVAAIGEVQKATTTLKVQLANQDPLKAEQLAAAQPWRYDDIIILSQGGGDAAPERVDSETIIILLLLRSILAQHPEAQRKTRLITEVQDSENQELISRAGVNDFVISNRLVSKIFAQVSEQRLIKKVYDDLFQAEGSELYLKPEWLYLEQLPLQVSFADLMVLAQKRKEVCIGVKIGALERTSEKNYGVTLNPEKNTLYNITADDCLVVLAEDDS
jgi:hypothetical protein